MVDVSKSFSYSCRSTKFGLILSAWSSLSKCSGKLFPGWPRFNTSVLRAQKLLEQVRKAIRLFDAVAERERVTDDDDPVAARVLRADFTLAESEAIEGEVRAVARDGAWEDVPRREFCDDQCAGEDRDRKRESQRNRPHASGAPSLHAQRQRDPATPARNSASDART